MVHAYVYNCSRLPDATFGGGKDGTRYISCQLGADARDHDRVTGRSDLVSIYD